MCDESGFYMTTGNNQLRGWTKKKLQSTSHRQTCMKKGHDHCLVVAADLIHYSFLNPGETITPEKYAQQIEDLHRKLQCLQPALSNRKGPILHDYAQPHVAQARLQKLNKLGYEVLLIHYVHLTSQNPTTTFSSNSTTFCKENASTISRRQKMLSKGLSNPKAWVFMLQE